MAHGARGKNARARDTARARVIVPRVVLEVVVVLGEHGGDRPRDKGVDRDPAVPEVRVNLRLGQRPELVSHEAINHLLERGHLLRLLVDRRVLPVNALEEQLPCADRHDHPQRPTQHVF